MDHGFESYNRRTESGGAFCIIYGVFVTVFQNKSLKLCAVRSDAQLSYRHKNNLLYYVGTSFATKIGRFNYQLALGTVK